MNPSPTPTALDGFSGVTLASDHTPPTQRDPIPPPPIDGVTYVLDGRPGRHHATLDDACTAASDLVTRLRLSCLVKVRERGQAPTLATVNLDTTTGRAVVVRYTGGTA